MITATITHVISDVTNVIQTCNTVHFYLSVLALNKYMNLPGLITFTITHMIGDVTNVIQFCNTVDFYLSVLALNKYMNFTWRYYNHNCTHDW